MFSCLKSSCNWCAAPSVLFLILLSSIFSRWTQLVLLSPFQCQHLQKCLILNRRDPLQECGWKPGSSRRPVTNVRGCRRLTLYSVARHYSRGIGFYKIYSSTCKKKQLQQYIFIRKNKGHITPDQCPTTILVFHIIPNIFFSNNIYFLKYYDLALNYWSEICFQCSNLILEHYFSYLVRDVPRTRLWLF